MYSFPAFMATRSGAVAIARSSGFLFPRSVAGDGWTITMPHISDLQREASGRLSSFKQKVLLEEQFNSFDVKSLLPAQSKSIWSSLQEFQKQLSRHYKGMLMSTFYIQVQKMNGLYFGTTVTSYVILNSILICLLSILMVIYILYLYSSGKTLLYAE